MFTYIFAFIQKFVHGFFKSLIEAYHLYVFKINLYLVIFWIYLIGYQTIVSGLCCYQTKKLKLIFIKTILSVLVRLPQETGLLLY